MADKSVYQVDLMLAVDNDPNTAWRHEATVLAYNADEAVRAAKDHWRGRDTGEGEEAVVITDATLHSVKCLVSDIDII